jgi:hypothetical protein
MLRLDLTTIPGGVRVNWRKTEDESLLSFHRRDGSVILKIHAEYADERSLVTAAHALNFMFKSIKNAKARDDRGDSGADRGNSPES